MDAERDATQDAARQAVGRYYDRNTKGFLSAGEGGQSLAIHRGVWGPGIAIATEAAEYVPGLILAQARETGARRILDLGCGVGGTCLFLARGLGDGMYVDHNLAGSQAGITGRPTAGTPTARMPTAGQPTDGPRAGDLPPGGLRITGMTISGAQLRLGRKMVDQYGLEGMVELLQGDYTDPASFAGLPPQDLVIALESFIHSPDLGATLANASAALRPGGRLVICDDMIQSDPGLADRDLADFRRCWHAYGLDSREAFKRLCQSLGLRLLADDDLSSLLHLFRPRDRLAAFFLPVLRLFRNWPWAQNLVGGTALQRLLDRGCLAYRYQVWVKPF